MLPRQHRDGPAVFPNARARSRGSRTSPSRDAPCGLLPACPVQFLSTWASPASPTMPRPGGRVDEYDVLVIGSGPAGQKAAIAASKLGRRAAVVDRADMLGGVCVNTGTIPSKTMREAVLHLTGLRHREHYGTSYRVKEDI